MTDFLSSFFFTSRHRVIYFTGTNQVIHPCVWFVNFSQLTDYLRTNFNFEETKLKVKDGTDKEMIVNSNPSFKALVPRRKQISSKCFVDYIMIDLPLDI